MINYILLNCYLLITYFYFLHKLRHGFHILQLESYMNLRYIKWMKKNKEKIITLRELLLIIPSILIFFDITIGLCINIGILLLLLLGRNTYKEKKPLVITNRIKRLYCTISLFLIVFIIFSNIFINHILIFGILVAILNLALIFSYFKVISVNTLNLPIEFRIQKGYYTKANNKLKQMHNLKVIGITGSYGKTSTKYILSTILGEKFNVLMTPESYNTTMGVVKTINENLKPTHEIFVCEMGAKRIGDIKEICDLVNPNYAVLTAIGPQHLETFKSIENIKKTKLELVDSLTKNGVAFLNYQDENIKKSKIDKNKITFGLDKTYDYYADNIIINEKGSSFDVYTKSGDIIPIKTKLLGKLNIVNIVGAISVAKELGMNIDQIKSGARFLKPVPHRLELKQNVNGSIIIDDAYNSNIEGAKMALEVLKKFKERTRILITPGIVELGEHSEEYNKILGMEAANSSDYIILVGKKQSQMIIKGLEEKNYPNKKIFVAQDLNEALKKMNEIITPKSVILLENDLPDNYL